MKIIDLVKRWKKKKNVYRAWQSYYKEDSKKLEFSNLTIYEYLKDSVGDDLEMVALNYFNHRITYREFFKEIDILGKAFRTLGVKENDIVTICMPNIPEALTSFYALNKIGAVADFLHPLSAPEEIKQALRESKSRILLTVDFNYHKVKNIIDDTYVYKTVIVDMNNSMPFFLSWAYALGKKPKYKNPLFFEDNYLKWDQLLFMGENCKENFITKMKSTDRAIILHSGGTTGTPKGIVISNYSFNALARQGAINVKEVKAQDKVLTILPVFHGFGLGVCIHCPLCLKVETILVPQYNGKNMASILKRAKPNVIAGVPTLWKSILNTKYFKNIDLSSLKYMISGGDSLSVGLEERMNEFLREHKANIKITKGYGMTEAVAAVCFTFDGVNEPGSVGIPMVGNEICICKPNSIETLGCNKEGEICVTGPTLMLGYLNKKMETKNVLRRHKDKKIWLHTGDLGYIKENGVVYFTQRLKRVIVSSGFNIYPSVIESVICKHPKVLNCCVVSIPHPYKIHVAKAYIVLKENEQVTNVIKKEIKDLCEQNLAKFSWPKEYAFVDDLPMTLYGKVDYKLLEEQ